MRVDAKFLENIGKMLLFDLDINEIVDVNRLVNDILSVSMPNISIKQKIFKLRNFTLSINDSVNKIGFMHEYTTEGNEKIQIIHEISKNNELMKVHFDNVKFTSTIDTKSIRSCYYYNLENVIRIIFGYETVIKYMERRYNDEQQLYRVYCKKDNGKYTWNIILNVYGVHYDFHVESATVKFNISELIEDIKYTLTLQQYEMYKEIIERINGAKDYILSHLRNNNE